MTAIAVLLGLCAAFLLLIAGYLVGAQRGVVARDNLRKQAMRQTSELDLLRDITTRASEERDHTLRATIEEALRPIVQREQLTLDLSQLKSGIGKRDLNNLLERIARAGNFSAVVLSDEDGLPLAANAAADDAERLAANSSLVLLMADRMAGADRPQPLSVMVHDESNRMTLCRVLHVHDRRLTLTAVTTGDTRLTPAALDPALVKVAGMLANAQ